MPLTIAPPWITVMKPTVTSTSSNTTLTNDPHLFFTVPANKWVAFRGKVFFDTVAAADFKYAFNFSGTSPDPTIRIQVASILPGATAFGSIAVQQPTVSTVALTGTGADGGFITFDGIIQDASGSGFVLHFQWAQNSSSVSSTLVQYGSYIEYCVVD